MQEGQEQQPIGTPQSPAAPHSFDVPPPAKSGFSKKRILVVIAGLLILGGAGFGLALLTSNGQQQNTSTTQQTTATSDVSSSDSTDVPSVTVTKTFKTDFPRIEFTYPENWTVAENRDQEGVRIESPEFNYKSIMGNTVSGNFRIYIRQGARTQDSKYIGRGIAALPSEKLIYAAPASSQRPETNLSFFGLDTSNNFAFFMIVGNFALAKDESLGPNYGTEAETYIITGGYSSNELADDLATNPVPVEYFQSTSVYEQAIAIIKSLKIL